MVCKIAFCSEFLDIPDNAEERGEGEEGEEHRQLQSVMRVTQMQTKKKMRLFKLLYEILVFIYKNKDLRSQL